MKTFIKGLLLASFLACFIGCKGMDLVVDLTPWKRPIGQVRVSQSHDPAVNTDVEFHLNLKRSGVATGSEDLEVTVRMPGSRGTVTSTSEKKAVEEKKEVLPIPQLLTSR